MARVQPLQCIGIVLTVVIVLYLISVHFVTISTMFKSDPGTLKDESRPPPNDPLTWDTPAHYTEPFTDIVHKHIKTPIVKWTHYLPMYHRHFARFRGKEMAILEIGLFKGGSLELWKKYFGPKAKIYGIDIVKDAKKYEQDQIEIFIGNQENKDFLREVKKKIPKVDILIDDGGHFMRQQRNTFDEMFDHVKEDGGVYWAEDLHTSYWPNFGGGYKKPDTFIEFSKNWIDWLNAYHTQKAVLPSNFTNHVLGISYYDSVVVIEKQKKRDVRFLRFNH